MKLLKFHATWCGPCKILSNQLVDFNMFEIENIDVDQQLERTDSYNLRGVPTLILVDEEQKEVWRNQGPISKEDLETKISQWSIPKADLITI